MMNLLTIGSEFFDGLLILGLIVVAVTAFIISRRASNDWLDDTLAKH